MADREQWSNRELISAEKMNRVLNAAYDAAESLPEIKQDVENLKQKKADNLEFDTEENLLYLVSDGQRVGDGVAVAASGGGGGGSGGSSQGNNAVLTVKNTSGWISKTIPQGQDCYVTITWSSLEHNVVTNEDDETGNGVFQVFVNNVSKIKLERTQGTIQIKVSDYLSTGDNTVKIRVSDIYNNIRTISCNIKVVALSITSTFNANQIYYINSPINILYVPYGGITKTVHFKLDNQELTEVTTAINGTSASYTIPTINTKGEHTLQIWITANIEGVEEQLESKRLTYSFIVADPNDNTPIISSSFVPETSYMQYSQINIPYTIYTQSDTALIDVYVDKIEGGIEKRIVTDSNMAVATGTKLTYNYYFDTAGDFKVTIQSTMNTNVKRVFEIKIDESDIQINARADNLVFYLNPIGRSNDRMDKNVFEYRSDADGEKVIKGTFNNFNWILDGWKTDKDGYDILRLFGPATLDLTAYREEDNVVTETIVPFVSKINYVGTNGWTIEIEFATSDVVDFSDNFIKCISSDNDHPNGLTLNSQELIVKGTSTTLNTLYKDNEHIRVSIVFDPANANLLLIYIDGILSRASTYSGLESFTWNDVLTIGSEKCTTDIYSIRIYNTALSYKEIVNNWIADTRNPVLKMKRYDLNNIYDNNVVTPTSIPLQLGLPYLIVEGDRLSPSKSTSVTISGEFVDNEDPSKNFTFQECTMTVQGTSSEGYYRKNYDLKFPKGFTLSDGTHSDGYKIFDNSIPFNRFVIKADVASSESANNTELVMFYNDTCPYLMPSQREEVTVDGVTTIVKNNVRQGIEGRPIVVFHRHPSVNDSNVMITEFIGKYNFNLPKRAPEPYGYSAPDKDNPDDAPMESWEWEVNFTPNVEFKTCDFTKIKEKDNTPYWYDEFEARFPNDKYGHTNPEELTCLKELLSWVSSTYRNPERSSKNTRLDNGYKALQVTNDDIKALQTYYGKQGKTWTTWTSTNFNLENLQENNLDAPIEGSYDGYAYFTHETDEYLLCKFRVEAPQYLEKESALFYYLFTEFFLMMDSRAKNMFPSFMGDIIKNREEESNYFHGNRRKVVFMPYDMDTAIGTNNSGTLIFNYGLEDTSLVPAWTVARGTGNDPNELVLIFNGGESVLWNNIRDIFANEIGDLYASLRTGESVWSYDKVEKRFEDHQSKWSEAIFNEDMWYKYIIPYIQIQSTLGELTGEELEEAQESSKKYLAMLQGSKKSQRKWWLYNRFRYMDSKYGVGDADTNKLTFRANYNTAAGNDEVGIKLTSVNDLYLDVKWGAGSSTNATRVDENGYAIFKRGNIADSSKELEVHIYSGDLISKIENLSDYNPNELEFSGGVRLREIILGDTEDENSNLYSININNCRLLEILNLENCVGLGGYRPGQDAVSDIGLLQSFRLNTVNLKGTQLTSVSLPEACLIQKLYLPNTIQILDLRKLTQLNELVIENNESQTAPYGNINKVLLDGMPKEFYTSETGLNLNELLANLPEYSFINIKDAWLEFNTLSDMQTYMENLNAKQLKGMEPIEEIRHNIIIYGYNYYKNNVPIAPNLQGTINIKSDSGLTSETIEAAQEALDEQWGPGKLHLIINGAERFQVTFYALNSAGQEVVYSRSLQVKDSSLVYPSSNPSNVTTDSTFYQFNSWNNIYGSIVNQNMEIHASYIEEFSIYFRTSLDGDAENYGKTLPVYSTGYSETYTTYNNIISDTNNKLSSTYTSNNNQFTYSVTNNWRVGPWGGTYETAEPIASLGSYTTITSSIILYREYTRTTAQYTLKWNEINDTTKLQSALVDYGSLEKDGRPDDIVYLEETGDLNDSRITTKFSWPYENPTYYDFRKFTPYYSTVSGNKTFTIQYKMNNNADEAARWLYRSIDKYVDNDEDMVINGGSLLEQQEELTIIRTAAKTINPSFISTRNSSSVGNPLQKLRGLHLTYKRNNSGNADYLPTLTSVPSNLIFYSPYFRIYVPENKIDDYKGNGTNWSAISHLIVKEEVENGEFVYNKTLETITDNWNDIVSFIDSHTIEEIQGQYPLGSVKSFEYNNRKVYMTLIAYNTDKLSEETGNAKTTWLSFYAMPYSINVGTTSDDPYAIVLNKLNNTDETDSYINLFPSALRGGIKTVIKSRRKPDRTNGSMTTQENCKLWWPSAKEVNNSSNAAEGAYNQFYSNLYGAYNNLYLIEIANLDKVFNIYTTNIYTRSAYFAGMSSLSILLNSTSRGFSNSCTSKIGFCI